MKRTTVFADEDDLAIIKAAAARRGIAEAGILRDAIHLAAMANRTWSEPFFSRTISPAREATAREATAGEILEQTWSEGAQAYERTKIQTP
jgi:hypothetical protein